MHAAGRAANLRYSISLTDSDTDTKWILFMILVKAYTEYSTCRRLYLFLYGSASPRNASFSPRAAPLSRIPHRLGQKSESVLATYPPQLLYEAPQQVAEDDDGADNVECHYDMVPDFERDLRPVIGGVRVAFEVGHCAITQAPE